MWTLIFILVYIVSVFVGFADTCRENKFSVKAGNYTIGDLLWDTPSFFYIPVINTLAVVIFLISFMLYKIFQYCKLDKVMRKLLDIQINKLKCNKIK